MDLSQGFEMRSSLQTRQDTDLDKTLRKLRAKTYPQYAVYLLVCTIFVAALCNAASILYNYLSLRAGMRGRRLGDNGDRDTEAAPAISRRRIGGISLRRMPLAAVNAVRIVAFRVSLPVAPNVRIPLFEVFVCLAHLLAILLFEFVNSWNLADMLDITYWANRAADLAVSQLAFILALSGKNNIISLLTGISYEKLNIFHRSASRVVLLLIWTHMWARWKLGLTGDDSMKFVWLHCGIAANTCLTLLVILGTRQLRDRNYEFFLAVHIVLSVVFLIAASIHVTNDRKFLPYVWSACIIWGLDRFLRLVRVLRIRYLNSKCKGSHAQATIKALSSDTVAVSMRIVQPSCSLFKFGWRPGQSAYLTVPAVTPWSWGVSIEAHPFTIASIDETVERDGGEEDELEMKFIIRVRDGFTRRLHGFAVSAGGSCAVSAFVDGPYGDPPNVYFYPNVVLVAGGSGVSFTLPLLLDLVRRARKETPDTLCKKVKFVWYIRERIHYESMKAEFDAIQANLPANLEVEINVFVTGNTDDSLGVGVASLGHCAEKMTPGDVHHELEDSTDSSKEKLELELPVAEDEKDEKSAGSGTGNANNNKIVHLEYGRPVIAKTLEEEVIVCEDSVAVCVSGPQTLIDDVRGALAKRSVAGPMNVLRGGASVFLHVEHFGM
ncbi:uncharacterized protein FOMMEDRAFT_138344 [Fomitiporia mediterranea MF3/22]|uniref:uncharacterized protein n=1 Tax=Fomitiporia mediterranea (strain MF3/22) TaxID=694068 RepID=UPI000440792B|nr:uncharacterized protein FOMMEDRAFT_138344 [Fomitiporia mediterranea MF3/22]EJD06301.1 hypothetical protein FOMMEDRAFT_138344 [Fomitiporia mediterranea MF3/22]